MSLSIPQGMEITGTIQPAYEQILTPEALALVATLTRAFEPRRQSLLAARAARAERLDAGERPDFLPETAAIRDGDWRIAPIPAALHCRRVEITGPVERKMVINALNSGADSYMTDFEDSNTPNWENQLDGQINMFDAVRGTIAMEQNGKSYKLNDKVATLSLSRYDLPFCSSEMVLRIASNRLIWPLIWLSQLGVFESSKSVMSLSAPEFSALMTILRSTGPVISTRRQCSAAGIGAMRQSPSRIAAVSGKKSGRSPASRRAARSARAASKAWRRGSNARVSVATSASASGVRICS